MKIQIDGWKQHLCFSAAHFLPQHQQCSILHGHTYVVSCTIEGTLDPKTNMIIDFSTLKNILQNLIKKLDHRILIPEQHPTILQKTTEIIITNKTKKYTFPIDDCVLLPIPSTTAEHLAQHLLQQLIKQITFAPNLQKITLQIHEGLGQSATAEHTF